jgi:hypothetical protein
MYDSYFVTRQGVVPYTSETEKQNQRYRKAQAQRTSPYLDWEYRTETRTPQSTRDGSAMKERVRELENRVRELEKQLETLDNMPVDLKDLKKKHLFVLGEALGVDLDYLDKPSMIELLSAFNAAQIRRAAREADIQL